MQKQADITFQNGVFLLTGELDFSNVMSVYQKSLPYFNNGHELKFDFSQLKSTNSAGVALIVEWVKLAKKNNKPISFQHFSEDLHSIIKAAGLQELV